MISLKLKHNINNAPLRHLQALLAVLFVRSVQGGVATGVKGRGALGLHGRAEAVLEDCLTLGLVHSSAMF